ncbi:nucleolar protein 6 [Phymastichus coffea]|uniref:nucleolar protein 6 n=1 Tax=Phymastichus coffea TaxID=108790 RepID=UPI00273B37CD|nr:nucleolar protein 6 [Phymastichus coffea]
MNDQKKKKVNLKLTKNVKTNEKSKNENDLKENEDQSFELNSKKRKLIVDDDNNNSSTTKKKKFDKRFFKQPTAEELNQLSETENLFHSNLFRLQIEEVLKAVKIQDKYKNLFTTWFEQFKNHVNAIKSENEFQLMDDTYFEKCNIKVPITKLPNDCVGIFKYIPPSSIIVGGSYSSDTIIGPNISIDIFVEMPENMFSKIDSKNYRYIRKKAVYLAFLASKINEEIAESKSFVGNHWNPILKIIPQGNLNEKMIVYVHAAVQESTFLPNKFTAEKNNVRPNWFFKATDKNKDVNSPTPYYNAIVMQDLTVIQTTSQINKLIKEYPNIKDGIILLKIWLKQRELCNNFVSFNGHVITMYVLYLLIEKKLNIFMSSYQIVRNTWLYLASSDWCKDGISLCKEEEIKERIEEYHKHYDCVFIDFTGFHNVAANISADTFKWVANQAKQSLNCLNNTRFNGFQILFMRKVPFYKAFDMMICLHNVKALENILEAHSTESDKLNYGTNKYVQSVKLILKLLEKGLTSRVSIISVLPHKVREWGINEEMPNDLERLYIGIQLDPTRAFYNVEKGPVANLPEAKQFRAFWGNKCEIRRFKDGNTCETVLWAKEKTARTLLRGIPQKIIKFLLEEKLKLFEKSHYFIFSNQVEQFLKLKKVKITKFYYSPEEASLKVINVFDSLKNDCINLTNLPLSINGVQGCSSLFRYSEVFPPLATIRRSDKKNIVDGEMHLLFNESSTVEEVPLYLAPVEATIQLSTSGKWPDDLEALRMTKSAFYIQIADSLRKYYKETKSKILVHGSMNHIDIMKDGFVFRLKLALQKEISLVKRVKDTDGVIKYRDNEESLTLERDLFHLPKLTGALYGLHCQHQSFGPACCLVKRWLAAQLIDNSHMPDIAVELLLASIYLNSEPYIPSNMPQVVFLRFLEAFANEHWHTDPIIVNFNDEMTREEIVEIENLFGTSRDTLPTLFICTPYDKQASIWTKKAPTTLILNRISALAKESLRLLEIQFFNGTGVQWKSIFIPPLSAYDCLIQLKTSLNSRRYEAVCVDETLPELDLHPFKIHYETKIPIVDFDPVAQYLKELRRVYEEFALFFHDTYGGNIIGVLLKPDALQPKDFKVSNVSCQKFNDDQKLVLNVSAMIEDFYILGKGLVEAIEIQSKKLRSI